VAARRPHVDLHAAFTYLCQIVDTTVNYTSPYSLIVLDQPPFEVIGTADVQRIISALEDVDVVGHHYFFLAFIRHALSNSA
jgi:hypothetical protein